MNLLVRSVVSGFGLALGAALFRRLAKQLGLEDVASPTPATAAATPTPPPSQPAHA